jgi:hypothetical protein
MIWQREWLPAVRFACATSRFLKQGLPRPESLRRDSMNISDLDGNPFPDLRIPMRVI